MRRLIRCFSVVAVLAVVGLLLSGTAWAQTISILGASGVNTGTNKADYSVAGSVSGVAGAYEVKVWIWDNMGVAIDSTVVSQPYGTTWHANIKGVAGGDSTHVCLLGGEPPMCLEGVDDTAVISYPVPATSTTGMIVILLLVASVASLALWRRAASRA
jgi:hypothetical protein